MSQQRIDALLAMAQTQPDETMVWYGLANEYFKLARWRETVDALRRVVSLDANYTSAYQMLGTSLMNLGEREEAWRDGIEVANRTGAWKARQHMEGLLAEASDAGDASGLCQE